MGRRQKRGVFILLKKPVPSAPGKGRRQRCFSIFLKKIMCREPGAKAVGKDDFLFF
jgi:hypothetical protein